MFRLLSTAIAMLFITESRMAIITNVICSGRSKFAVFSCNEI